MLRDYRILETFSRVAPLGIQFVNAATRRPILETLDVVGYDTAVPSNRIRLFPNRSNVYVLRGIAELRDFETGAGDAGFWDELPAPAPYTIEVRDPAGNYHPFKFTARVPARGVLEWDCAGSSPPETATAVPMFTTRQVQPPPGTADIRAMLYDPERERPARWALLRIMLGGSLLGYAVTDRDGQATVSLPYPEPIDLLPGSPLSLGQPFTSQTWPIEAAVAYDPALHDETLPDLCALLSQAPGTVWDVWLASPPAGLPHNGDNLRFGKPLVLRSRGTAGGRPLSVLLVTA